MASGPAPYQKTQSDVGSVIDEYSRLEAERSLAQAINREKYILNTPTPPISLGLTPPPLPLDFKLKCLELAVASLHERTVDRDLVLKRANAFYDWLTGKDEK